MKQTFELVKNYKRYKNSKPLILMGYYQIIFHYGEKKFVKKWLENYYAPPSEKFPLGGKGYQKSLKSFSQHL